MEEEFRIMSGGGGGPRGPGPMIGGGGMMGPRGPMPIARPMSDHYFNYHHPKPRFFRPFYNVVAPYYYYPFDYYYPGDAYGRKDEPLCFCKDVQYKDKQVCVNGVCGTCAPESICDECDDTVTCDR